MYLFISYNPSFQKQEKKGETGLSRKPPLDKTLVMTDKKWPKGTFLFPKKRCYLSLCKKILIQDF